jgi:hypothetical protein
MMGDAFATSIGAVVEYGLNINSVDYGTSSLFFNAASDHRQVGGPGVLPVVLPAGSYTVTMRWRRVSGAQVNMDANSRLKFLLWEVAPRP